MRRKHLLAAWLVLAAGCALDVLDEPELERVAEALMGCSAPEGSPGASNAVYYGSWGASGQPGTVSACRKLEGNQMWTGWVKPGWAERAKRAIQFRYVTRDAAGRNQPATALLLVPNAVPASNAGKAPLIALASGTAGLADACAPSLATRRNESIVQDQAAFYLGLGMTVVIPDYLGLGTELTGMNPWVFGNGTDVPYLEGPSAARVVLDALRAARTLPGAHFDGGTIPSDWPASVSGGSLGGHAALWTSASAAPEDKLRASIGVAPPVDLAQLVPAIDAGGYSLLNAYILSGFFASTDSETQGVDERAQLSQQGRDVLAKVRTTCIAEFSASSIVGLYGDTRMSKLLQNWAAFQTLPRWKKWLEKNSLLFQGSKRTDPRSPVLVLHGAQDDTVPLAPGRALLVQQWGAQVVAPPTTFFANVARADRAFLQVPVGNHFTVGGIETETVDANNRYAPFEWYLDSVFSRAR
ncbi:MAG: lipase family protein [Polyangiales bacterium]